jgi:UDP-N-acetylglucosamine 2-epimerase
MSEERNRILTDHLSSMLFAPTNPSERNLKDEHVKGDIISSGDISVEWKIQ